VCSATNPTGTSRRLRLFHSAGLRDFIFSGRCLGVNQISFSGDSGGAPCAVICADLKVDKDLGKKEKCFGARILVLIFLSQLKKLL